MIYLNERINEQLIGSLSKFWLIDQPSKHIHYRSTKFR